MQNKRFQFIAEYIQRNSLSRKNIADFLTSYNKRCFFVGVDKSDFVEVLKTRNKDPLLAVQLWERWRTVVSGIWQ